MSQRMICAVAVCVVLIATVCFVIKYEDQYTSPTVVKWTEWYATNFTLTDMGTTTHIPETLSGKELASQEPASQEPAPEKQDIKTDTTSKFLTTKPFTTFLLIMVPILPKSFRSREIIRSTWYKGLNDSKDVMLRFAMATAGLDDADVTSQLATENRTHGDLIYFDNLGEGREVLTNKTLLLMQWAYSNVNFSYLLKCDDDTYVFVERMITELKKRPSATRLYYGKVQTNGNPQPAGVWKDTSWKLGKTYLPFAIGGGYILSSDLIRLIIENIEYLQWHPNEDTAVGSWLAPYRFELRDDKLICRSLGSENKNCPNNNIMHLFWGIKRDKLDEIFRKYAGVK